MEKTAFSANDQSKGTAMTTYGSAPGANAAPEKGDRISEATKVLKALMRSWIMLALAGRHHTRSERADDRGKLR